MLEHVGKRQGVCPKVVITDGAEPDSAAGF